jgi:hypothetical protein
MTMITTTLLKGLRSVRHWGQHAIAFVAAPSSASPLTLFRAGLAAVLLAQALMTAGALPDLYGSLGIVQRPINDALIDPVAPRVGWLADALAPYGVSEEACLYGVFVAYLLSLTSLLVGWHTRGAAAVVWLTHMALGMSGFASIYGADHIATICLFYCVFMPVGQTASLDRWKERTMPAPSAGARLALRVLQLHLCMVYLSSGLFKASGAQWWSGEAFWRAVMRQDFGQFDLSWLAAVPWIARLACWGTLVVEVGYAFFIWPRRTRRLWAWATVGMHTGIAVTLGLWSFSALMIVLNTSAFLVPPETQTRSTREGEHAPGSQEVSACPVEA